jgi:soluble lytic murein transglycosylase-like protein
MKFVAFLALFLFPAFARDFYPLPQPPEVRMKLPPLWEPWMVRHPRPNVHALIRTAAQKHKVPAALVKSIVAAESNFDCDAVSPKGAIGPMQLMPQTAQQLGADPRIPEQNVDAGTRYLRFLLDKYRKYRDQLKRAIAAYNAGPAVVDKYRGVPPFPETRLYVTRVLAFLRMFQHEGM